MAGGFRDAGDEGGEGVADCGFGRDGGGVEEGSIS